MTHSRLNQIKMFDWIRASIDAGESAPTDADIVTRFDLPSIESARSLLADLADRGDISIRGTGEGRTITLGRKHSAPTPAPRPTPSVVKRHASGKRTADEHQTAARIREILARGKAAVGPESTNTPEVSGTARKAPSGSVLADPSRASGSTSPPVSAPATASAPARVRVAEGAQRRGSHCDGAAPPELTTQLSKPVQRLITAELELPSKHVNMKLQGEDYAKLAEFAEAAGVTATAYARDMVLAAMSGDMNPVRITHEPEPKPRIRGAIASAAARDEMPILDFIHMLLERGFAAYERDAALERAA